MEKVFGLIGQTLSHSFSKSYFDEKFFRDGIKDHHYELFEIKNIEDFPQFIKDNPNLCGLNVTLPYKEKVMKFLDELDEQAKNIGAVNVIKINKGKLKGFNTDYIAFKNTLDRWIPEKKGLQALILGTGGSSKAIQQALKELKIKFKTVSREAGKGDYTYAELEKDPSIIEKSKLIINATPMGMTPNTTTFPAIRYDLIGKDHYLYDLIYNPARTVFIQKAEMRDAHFKNGLEMLHEQAENAWMIWNS
ncbi:MAG TPA: shikimate dehydrogenase [Cyclobacteriaceae bacterium]|nr:shikimate dehydrogenase [Cyclobacteriaceae bacterium]